jgi:uncharacterized OB-fold protein
VGHINYDTQLIWDGWQRRELRAPRCADCGTWLHFSGRICPECWSEDVTTQLVPGAGRIVTYSLPRVPSGHDPVVTVVAAFDEAPNVRLLARLAGCDPEQVTIGMSVTVDWRDDDGHVVPELRPAVA